MYDIIKVSLIILAWFGLISLIWQLVCFEYLITGSTKRSQIQSGFIIPAIVLSPLVLVTGFKLLGIYLIFPVNILSTMAEQIKSGFVPGFVVFLASGVCKSIYDNTYNKVIQWSEKPFCLMSVSYGQSKRETLRYVVCSSSFIDSISSSLPWVFGELFIVECIFNAPGISYEAWKSAKMEDYDSMKNCLLLISLSYLIIWSFQSIVSKRLKKRLVNYV